MEYDIQTVYWDDVESFAPEEYNEAFLAGLREKLKKNEAVAAGILLEPHFFSGKGSFWACAERRDGELFEAFTAAMVHTARRLKDCIRIAGFVLPDFENDWAELVQSGQVKKCTTYFKQAFEKKHGHFVFAEKKIP